MHSCSLIASRGVRASQRTTEHLCLSPLNHVRDKSAAACLQSRRVRKRQPAKHVSPRLPDVADRRRGQQGQRASNKRAVDSDKGPYSKPPAQQEQPLMYLPGADDPFDPEECKARALGLMAHFPGHAAREADEARRDPREARAEAAE